MAIALLAWIFAIPALGFCTGLRTMTPMAVLCWFSYMDMLPVHHDWAFWTTKLVTAIVFTVLAAGELIGDKLPQTPNRTSPFALIARIVFGGLVGAICATGLHGELLEGVLLGAIAAVAGAFIGYNLRRHLVQVTGIPDIVVALCEDGFAIAMSVIAVGIVTG
jgi:uncharacterized membrane protein